MTNAEKTKWKKCESKKALSEQNAKFSAKRIRERHTTPSDKRMFAYQCPYHAEHWHLGHVSLDSKFYRDYKQALDKKS